MFACECCYEDHISSGGVSDDWEGGLPVVVEVASTGEHRCDTHREVGARMENGAGFGEFDPADIREVESA